MYKEYVHFPQKSVFLKKSYLAQNRIKKKLTPLLKYNEYISTLNYYRNVDKFQENHKNIFFTNEEISSHLNNYNNDVIKSNSKFKKQNLLLNKKLKNGRCYTSNCKPLINKNKNLEKNSSTNITNKNINNNVKSILKVETSIDTIDSIKYPNLVINKVNFNIRNISSKDFSEKIINLNDKMKKNAFQYYNQYNINKRNKFKILKSYSSEKNIERLNENRKNNIKQSQYFSIQKLNKKNKKELKYISVYSQIKIDNSINKKKLKKYTGNNIFDNIATKIEKSSNFKIKLNNIMERTKSKNLDD
jgi:hypothetical protein